MYSSIPNFAPCVWQWSICWKGTRFLPSDYRAAYPHQRLNHLIGSAKVTRKVKRTAHRLSV